MSSGLVSVPMWSPAYCFSSALEAYSHQNSSRPAQSLRVAGILIALVAYGGQAF